MFKKFFKKSIIKNTEKMLKQEKLEAWKKERLEAWRKSLPNAKKA
jgi:hypothetical protein